MKSSTKTFLAVVLLISLLWLWRERPRDREESLQETTAEEVQPQAAPDAPLPSVAPTQKKPVRPIESAVTTAPARPLAEPTTNPPPAGTAANSANQTQQKKPPEFALKFVVEDGHAVVEGDIVLGQPSQEDGPITEGHAVVPKMDLWPTRRIPYHIQPHLSDPDRVHQALALFSNTVMEFVPSSGQEQDVLVFETGTGHCKSYVGRIGGKQPIWLSPGCGPREIAHEILHALGFIHEQNRADRDTFIEVINDNVDPRFAGNFEKFPMDFMRVSGLASFDFESIMIYPPWMFAKQGRSTMRPHDGSNRIIPGEGLSPADVERLRQAYGGR